MKFAIIAGTGFERVQKLGHSQKIGTPYGEVQVYTSSFKNIEFYYIPRHGKNHTIAPHNINYRANVYALKELNVDINFSICAVGSLNKSLPPTSFVLIKDIIDRTKTRVSTFYDGINLPLRHVDVSNLYNLTLRQLLQTSFSHLYQQKIPEVVYVCTEGPRFETAAEINEYCMIGADVVGMTNAPEIFLLHEMGIFSATIGYVTNFCTGISKDSVTLVTNYKEMDEMIKTVIVDTVLNVENMENLGPKPIFF